MQTQPTKTNPTILLTGVGGNIGNAIWELMPPSMASRTYITTRDKCQAAPNTRHLDFEVPQTFGESLEGIDILFLLRPPHISAVKKYFGPLIQACMEKGVKHIIFLSVQGAEKSRLIPHSKIEKLIRRSGIAYTFIRPSYFMQNLTTTLSGDLRDKSCIILPAGKSPFLWVDVRDIALVAIAVMEQPLNFRTRVLTPTGKDLLNFDAVAGILTDILQRKIKFLDQNPLQFFFHKRMEGLSTAYTLVLIMLHYLARFQPAPEITTTIRDITGKEPSTLKNFIEQNKNHWI